MFLGKEEKDNQKLKDTIVIIFTLDNIQTAGVHTEALSLVSSTGTKTVNGPLP